MPNRILKESIITSDSLSALSWFEEVLFYRLLVSCDDFGRFDGRTAVIKNRLFPLKENLTMKMVSDGINKLASLRLISLYENDGKLYLFIPTWNEHQTIRCKKSKFPDPAESLLICQNDENLQANEIICKQMKADVSRCKQMQANVPVIQSNTIQSKYNPNQNPTRVERAIDTPFDRFWSAYPKKVGKGEAKKAFSKVKIPVDALIGAVERQKESKQWKDDNGRFIPNPSTWLNQGRWEDELDLRDTQYQRHGSEISETAKKAIQDALRDGGDC